jgi:tetratricopeptide (TPR) repeat protein
MMQHRFHAVIALTLVVAGLAQGADPQWVKMRSANFELFTSAGERAGRRTIQEFERTRSFFRQAMQREASIAKPVRIVLFRSQKEYLPYRPGEATAAYYLSGPDADLIVLVAGNESSAAIHEYVHLLVHHAGLRLPRWLNEGLADLYSSMRQVGGQVVVGYAPPGRIATLSRERWEPLGEVLVAGREHYTEKERAGIFYAESWALTHMLNLSEEYRPKLTELLQLLTAGTPSLTALETVYEIPVEKLQRELQSYVRQDRLNGLVFDIKLEKSAERPLAEPAAGLEVGLLLADLLANIKKTDEARAMYEKVSSENPEAPGPYEGLGYLEYRLGDKDQARIQFGRAFELGGKSPKMLRRYAGLQREAGDEKMVLTLLRAVRSSPEDVQTRLVLGSHLLQKGSYGLAAAILGQFRNADAEQARTALRMLAYARLKLNQRESGRQVARQLLELARTPEEVNDA